MSSAIYFRNIAASSAVGLWLATGWSLPAVFGQETIAATAPTSQPAAVTREEISADLTAEAIDARMQRTKASTDLDEATRSELLGLYTEALEELRAAANSAAAAAQFDERREKIPAELDDIRARLEQARTRPASRPAEGAPADVSLKELTERLEDAEDEFAARTKALRQVDDDLKRRSDRRTAIPIEVEAASARLEMVARALADSAAVSGVDPEIAAARRIVLSARRKAMEQQIRTYTEELRYLEAIGDLLTARRDESRSQLAEAEAAVVAWREVVTARRQVEAEEQKRRAQEQLADVPEPVRDLVTSNWELAEERLKLGAEIEELTKRSGEVAKTVEDLDKQLASLSEKVRTAGMSTYIGPMLVRERARLPDVHAHKRQIQALRSRAAAVEGRLFELGEIRDELSDLDTLADELSQQVLQVQPTRDATEVAGKIRNALQTRLDTVRPLRQDYERCWNDILALNVLENRLVARTNSMDAFISEHILWVRSHPPLYRAEIPEGFVSSRADWRIIGRGLWEDVGQHPGVSLAAAAALLFWLGLFRTVRTRLRVIDERVKYPYSDSFGLTLEALGIEAFLAVPIPALMLYLSARLVWAVSPTESTAYELTQGLSAGLTYPALGVFVLLFLRRLCRRGGVGEVHLQWSPRATQRLHRKLLPVAGILGASSFLAYVAASHPDSAWRDSVSRGTFLVCVLTILYLARILLHPSRGAVAMATGKADQGRLRSAAGLRYLLTAAILVALAVTSAVGYHHTALILTQLLGRTVTLIAIVVVLRAIVLRFVRVSQQKVAFALARKARARRAAQQAEGNDQGAQPAPIEEEAFEVQAVSEHTVKLVRWLAVFTVTVGIWAIWRDVFPAFSFLNRIELWSYTVTTTSGQGEEIQILTRAQPVYLSDLLLALIVGALTVVLATNGPRILELVLLARLLIEPSVRFAIAALARYAIVIAGVIIAFQAVGIGWHQVQWLAAAITVGLGFGLQEIFANFISGLIILFERPVRIGDAVTVGDVTGRVTRIRMRATTVTDFDNRELIVPNKEFITSRIMNWTLSSPVTRVTIPVGIAYGSDTALAREMLLKVARECEHVLDDPAPSAIFRSFGESSLNFELRVFIPKRDVWPEMIDHMHTRIDAAFRQAKIEIAFPQRDVHVRSIRDVLPVNRQPATETSTGHDDVEGGRMAGKE